MFVIILQTFMHWMDILMLGYFTNAETVGLYHPAARTAGLLQSLLMSFISIYAPMISQFHSEQNLDKMNEAYKLVSRWLVVFSIPVSVVFVTFPGNILALFGQEYTASSSVLIILTVATLIQAIFGAASPTLGMAGFPKIVLINTSIAFSMNFALNVFLIPKFGVEGAAFATLSTLSIIGCVRALQVRMILKMNFLSFKMIKPVISGILTYVLLTKIKPLMLDFSFLVELFIALLSCGLFYLLLLWLLGIDDEDKNFITGLGIIKKGFGKKEMNFNLKNIFFLSLLLFTGILIFLFEPIIFGGKMFGSPDSLSPRSVGMALNNASKEIGGYPHWQPWIFSGMPTAESFSYLSKLYFPEYIFKIFSFLGQLSSSFIWYLLDWAACNCFATLSVLVHLHCLVL